MRLPPTLKRTDSNDPDFRRMVAELDKYLTGIFGAAQKYYDPLNSVNNVNTAIIAYQDRNAVGCGCLREFSAETVELKRMFVTKQARGMGIATSILLELEKWAEELGYKHIILETGTLLWEANALYKKNGYQLTEKWGEYVGVETSVCMTKILR